MCNSVQIVGEVADGPRSVTGFRDGTVLVSTSTGTIFLQKRVALRLLLLEPSSLRPLPRF